MGIGARLNRAVDRVGLWAIPIAIAVVAVTYVGLIFCGDGVVRHSASYTQAMDFAQASKKAHSALGAPVEQTSFASGFVLPWAGGSGFSMLQIPVKGPSRSGLLMAVGSRRDSVWTLNFLLLCLLDTNQTINLLNNPAGAPTDLVMERPSIKLRRARIESPNSR